MNQLLNLFLCGMFAVALCQADPPAGAGEPPSDRAEQLEFDPKTGEWIEIEPPQPGTPVGDLAIARRHLTDGHASRSRRALKKWFKVHGEDHALAREARLQLAATRLADRKYYQAHKIVASIAAEFGTDDITIQAVEMDFVIAEVFLSGTKRKWAGMRIAPARDLGIKILDHIVANYPDTSLAQNALKTKADYYYQRGDFDLAEDEYNQLVFMFPRSQWLLEASLRRAQATLAQYGGTKFDDAALIEAEEQFLMFRNSFPRAIGTHDIDLTLEDIRNTRADKEYSIGEYYDRVGQADAAVFYFRSVLENWPGTVAATRAQVALGGSDLWDTAPANLPAQQEPPDQPPH